MTVGTRSLLFGVHQFVLHPIFLAIAWWRLYGPPTDPRLWLAFVVHDWGYWSAPNMDGPEGERHPERGATIMRRLFGPEWADLALLHSRYYAKAAGREPSALCWADKLATAIYPPWLWILLARLSGELDEYMTKAVVSGFVPEGTTPEQFLATLQPYWRMLAMHGGRKHDLYRRPGR